jgi:RecQ-mediated genome instability protein 1
MADPATQVLSALRAAQLPSPSQTWLANLLASLTSRPGTATPPLPALIASTKARLLASDLTALDLLDPTWVTANTLPVEVISDDRGEVREVQLPRDIVLQVLDVVDLSRPKWDAIEELQAIERGEMTRGRMIIRLPPGGAEGALDQDDAGAGDAPPEQRAGAGAGGAGGGVVVGAGRNATHRLTLQDCAGDTIYGLELQRIERIGVGKTNIGEKIRLRQGTAIARGMALLEPGNCESLGGKVEAWHRSWTEGRLARLREEVGAGQAQGRPT